jgi:MFS transporter, Spinster family, sphingosine-1-phosphate transporter
LQLKAMTAVVAGTALISASVYLTHSRYVAFGLMALGAVLASTATGPLFAVIQTVVPQRTRATAIAVVYLFGNLIGTGLGPLAAGALSDLLRPVLGEESLRYALLSLTPGYLWGAYHMWRARKTVALDAKAAELDPDETALRGHVSASPLTH